MRPESVPIVRLVSVILYGEVLVAEVYALTL